MFLVIAPALDGLRREWREASREPRRGRAGATGCTSACRCSLPSFLGAFVLLFGNAFSAYATAYALTGGNVNIVPLLIGAVLSGNVLSDPHLGKALALGMVVVMTATCSLYALLAPARLAVERVKAALPLRRRSSARVRGRVLLRPAWRRRSSSAARDSTDTTSAPTARSSTNPQFATTL